MKKILFLVVAAAFMFACSSPSGSEDTAVDKSVELPGEGSRSTTSNPLFNDLMIPATGGVFRGISFDMSKATLLDIETSRSTVDIYQDENQEEVIVTTDMGKEILDFADITYRFDEQGLYSIKVETYAVSLAGATEVFNMVIEKYTKAFGAPSIADDGFYEFSASDTKSSLKYSIAVKNIDDVEDSFGMYMYFNLL